MIDYLLGGLIVIAMLIAVRKIVKNYSSGGCGCGCSGCQRADKCHSAPK